MKNILKQRNGIIFLITLNELNKVEHVSKLKENDITSALLACLNIDQISIDQIIINDIEVKTSDILTPDIEDIQEPVKKVNGKVYEDLRVLYGMKKEKNAVKTPILPFYAELKAFTRERYNALKDSTCNTFEKLQDDILNVYGMSCTIEGLKNFCLTTN